MLTRLDVGPDPVPPRVALVPSAAYHVAELAPLAAELAGRGVPTSMLVVEPAGGLLGRWRTQRRLSDAVLAAAADAGWSATARGVDDSCIDGLGALVVMNDWGVTGRALVERARAAGVLTVGKVEGVQDFGDVDTGRDRRPYRQVDLVLCQGPNDRDALDGTRCAIVGSTRLETLWSAPPVMPREDLVVVNCNFSFGVLTSARRGWLRQVTAACRAADRRFVVSQHPADRGFVDPRHRSRDSVHDLLGRATGLVTRFSTLGFEAVARGVPFAYHNPHGEQVPTFQDPDGGFAITTDADELAAALAGPQPDVRTASEAFFRRQVDMVAGRSPAQRGADAILEAL